MIQDHQAVNRSHAAFSSHCYAAEEAAGDEKEGRVLAPGIPEGVV